MLFLAVKGTLQKEGILNRLRAEMRLEVVKAFKMGSQTTGKPKLPNEMLLVNELIREYLTWAGYKCSCTVFSAGILCAFIL